MTNSGEFTPEERAQIRKMLNEWRSAGRKKAQAEATRLTKELQGKYGDSS